MYNQMDFQKMILKFFLRIFFLNKISSLDTLFLPFNQLKGAVLGDNATIRYFTF